jgi:hypothetical protein
LALLHKVGVKLKKWADRVIQHQNTKRVFPLNLLTNRMRLGEMNLNVTDLRKNLRRSPRSEEPTKQSLDERRKTSDRRVLPADPSYVEPDVQRIWLTPGERTLIEDLYLLEDE